MQAKKILQELTGKKHIYLKLRGNSAIRSALSIIEPKGKILVQDQGGWLRYLDYPQKYGFTLEKVKTDYGVIDLFDLKKRSNGSAALLYEDPAGYIAEQPINEIFKICKNNNCKVILDITGSIGYRKIKDCADIIIASFGEGKPVNLGYGGFIASDDELDIDEEFDYNEEEFNKALNELKKRQEFLHEKSRQIKKELDELNIIHKKSDGINVVVAFDSEKEKEKILSYCEKNSLPYTICPRYIRVLRDAISIEVKKLA